MELLAVEGEETDMEPASGAALFAMVVALLGDFLETRRHHNSATLNEFLEYLASHGYGDLRQRLESNQRTIVSMKALLSASVGEILGRMDSLDQRLAAVASGVHGLGDLAAALRPDSVLSDQALSILRQLEESKGWSLILAKATNAPPALVVSGGSGRTLSYDEARFLETDLAALSAAGLLFEGLGAQGNPVYRPTRAGSALVRALSE